MMGSHVYRTVLKLRRDLEEAIRCADAHVQECLVSLSVVTSVRLVARYGVQLTTIHYRKILTFLTRLCPVY